MQSLVTIVGLAYSILTSFAYFQPNVYLFQNRKRIKYLEDEYDYSAEGKREDDEDLGNLWSDDSDVDPDFAPALEEKEEEEELISIPEITNKKTKPINKPRKNNTFTNKGKEVIKSGACLYCQQVCRHLSRHLKSVHSDENEVVKAMKLKQGSRERKAALILLRNKGNLIHNTNVITQKKGTLIFCRQKGLTDFKNIVICDHCLGFFRGNHFLNLHLRNCIILNVSKKLTNKKSKLETTKNKLDNFTDICKLKKACYYCNKLVSKLVTHLKKDHKEEKEVIHVMSLKSKSKERLQAIQTLKRKGNFVFIKHLLENYSDVKCKSLPCEHCLGFYSQNSLFKHSQKCYLNTVHHENRENTKKFTSEETKETMISSSFLLYSSIHQDESDIKQLSSFAKEGNEVIETIVNDPLIWRYGVKIADFDQQVIGEPRYFRLSTLARIVLRLRSEESSVHTLSDCLKTKHLNQVLKVISRICSLYIQSEKQERIIKMAIGHCCMIVKSKIVVEKDSKGLKEIKEFLTALKLANYTAGSANFDTVIENENNTTPNEEMTTGLEENLTKLEGKLMSPLNASGSDVLQEESVGKDSSKVEAVSMIVESDEERCYPKDKGARHKTNICLFCNKDYGSLAHHWTYQHTKEPEIKHFRSLQKGSTERALFIKELRNKGNFFHNLNAVKMNKDLVISVFTNSKYNKVPCEFCLGFYGEESISIHISKCPFNVFERIREGIVKGSVFTSPHIMKSQTTLVEELKEVMSSMSDENVKEIVNNDNLIMKFGLLYKEQEGSTDCGKDEVLLRMSELARLVREVKLEGEDVSNFRDCLQTNNFPLILKAAKKLMELECEEDIKVRFERLRKMIITCCSIVRAECVILKLKVGFVENNFMKMLFDDWLLTPEEKKDLVVKRHTMLKKLLVNLDESESFTTNSEREINPNDKRQVCVKMSWSENELDAVSKYFSNHIKNKKAPGTFEAKRCIGQNECLARRHWVSVKSKVQHLIKYGRKKVRNKNNPIQANSKGNVLNKGTFIKEPHSEKFHQQIKTLFPSSKTCSRSSDPIDVEPVSPNGSTVNTSLDEVEMPSVMNESSVQDVIDTLTNRRKSQRCRDLKLKTEGDKTYLLLDSFCATEIESIPSFTVEAQSGKKCLKRDWSECETEALEDYFEKHIKRKKIPSKYECEDCIEENEELRSRDWVSVKSKVHNIIKNLSKSNDGSPQISADEDSGSSSDEEMLQEDLANKNEDAEPSTGKSTNKSKGHKSKQRNRKNSFLVEKTFTPKNKPKSPWTDEENAAIDNFFHTNIEELKVPGKRECEECIDQNPCLNFRSWVVVKSKVYNIISTIKRQTQS